MNSRDVHIDAALTNVTVQYTPGGFVADIVAPIVPVDKESDKYYVFTREETLRTFQDLRADGAEANVVDMKLSEDTYFCEEYALKTHISVRTLKNADSALKLEMRKTKWLKNTMLLAREKRVAAKLRDLANYATGHKVTLSGTSQWSHASYAGDPMLEIDAGISAIYDATGGNFPNYVLMPYPVAVVFANNQKVLDKMKYTNGSLITASGVPKIIRNMNVVIPGAVETTSGEGASTATFAGVWGKDLIMGIANNGSTMDSLSQFYTFRNQEWETRKWFEEGLKSYVYETSVIEDVKRISEYAGYIIRNVIA